MCEPKESGFLVGAMTAVMAGTALYALSFGPICWLVIRGAIPRGPTFRIYRPILHHAAESQGLMRRYCECWGTGQQYLLIQDLGLDYE
jgi:hypothetical protein